MIIVIYQIYLMNCRFNSVEGFEGATQNLGGVDDANSINTLAQIARKLMDGSLTLPGELKIKGGSAIADGNVGFGGTGAAGFIWGNEGGNGWACLRTNDAKNDDSFCMHKSHGGGTRLHPGGSMTVKGRDILAELDRLNSRWDGEKLKAAGGILLANKWLLKDTGDDWIRVFNTAGTDYYGGVAARNLWSDGDQHLTRYPKLGQTISAHPINNNNPDAMFDFGSQGNTSSSNRWSIIQLVPR